MAPSNSQKEPRKPSQVSLARALTRAGMTVLEARLPWRGVRGGSVKTSDGE